MISGFNSDIVLDGVVYHIQTEDKGTQSAEIVTQVFREGAVIFARCSPYPSMTGQSNDASLLQGLVRSQHMKLLQFVRGGGLKRKDLLEKVMSGDHEEAGTPPKEEAIGSVSHAAPLKVAEPGPPPKNATRKLGSGSLFVDLLHADLPMPTAPRQMPVNPQEPLPSGLAEHAEAHTASTVYLPGEQCEVELLSPSALISGEIQPLRFRLRSNLQYLPLQNARISVKVYGTTIRPLCYSGRSDADGLFSIDLIIPRHSTGSSWVEVVAQTVLGLSTLKLNVSCPAAAK
jgi:hypothetical protein